MGGCTCQEVTGCLSQRFQGSLSHRPPSLHKGTMGPVCSSPLLLKSSSVSKPHQQPMALAQATLASLRATTSLGSLGGRERGKSLNLGTAPSAKRCFLCVGNGASRWGGPNHRLGKPKQRAPPTSTANTSERASPPKQTKLPATRRWNVSREARQTGWSKLKILFPPV